MSVNWFKWIQKLGLLSFYTLTCQQITVKGSSCVCEVLWGFVGQLVIGVLAWRVTFTESDNIFTHFSNALILNITVDLQQRYFAADPVSKLGFSQKESDTVPLNPKQEKSWFNIKKKYGRPSGLERVTFNIEKKKVSCIRT